MSNPNFIPGMSSNEIYYDTDTNVCLTDVVDGKAESAHTHTGYATENHTHTPASIGAAAEVHTHDYAVTNHEHSVAAITGLETALAAKADASVMSSKADLVNGLVPTSQLPAFVDDVLEYSDLSAFPTAGESGKIYVAQDTNKTYRWSGSAYVVISDTIALGETSATAYRGDRGKTAYDHSQNGTVHVTADQKTAWTNKQDALTFDSAPTADSTNPVTSGGVYTALQGKAASTHGHSYNDLTDKPTIPTIPSSLPANGGNADTVDGKHASDFAAASHTHDYAAANHTHNTNIIVEQAASPYMKLKLANSSLECRVYKNASTTADYGMTLADYDADGAKDSLIFCRKNALANKLYLNVQNDDDTRSLYYLYGEHHKPTLAEIGGGTITGDVNVNGVLRVNGQQSFYFQTSTMAQTVGTNNATGGTTICCGSNADVNVNGAHMKTATVVPRTNNVYMCGNATYRWAGIYSTAAVNVSSDERLKRDIKDMDSEALASFIDKLNVVSYNYKDDEADAKARIGLVAQDVQWADAEIAKFFVNEEEDGMLSLAPADFVFPLIAAVQRLTKRVEDLESMLDAK